ncbi:MAG: hypothetical protein KC435_09690 [Thermomicrobiales bacterium]|nr:hypothetical protein [Thermomicrobiales bacterium]
MIHPELLLAGPRGRRLLLEYALISDNAAMTEYDEASFIAAMSKASYNLDPGRGTSRVILSFSDAEYVVPDVSPEEVARRLANVHLLPVTSVSLRTALARAVDNARYWQEPDGEDNLAATPPMLSGLRRVADHIAASTQVAWWTDPFQPNDQWSIRWFPDRYAPELADASWLARWREEEIAQEERSQRERPSDPTANWSGTWWSIPPYTLAHTSRTLSDGSPAGVWFVEDQAGHEQAAAHPVIVPKCRICEIESAEAWVDLCQRYPLDVTWGKRHDWYRTTGRIGRWVMPDWSAVAREYDGVHLTVMGYLSAAGVAIPVDDTASVIAGWNPDETWWLTNTISFGEPVVWALHRSEGEDAWERLEYRE